MVGIGWHFMDCSRVGAFSWTQLIGLQQLRVADCEAAVVLLLLLLLLPLPLVVVVAVVLVRVAITMIVMMKSKIAYAG